MKNVICLVVVWVMAAANIASANNILYFTSSPTSWVGQGKTLTLTSPTTTFKAFRYEDNGGGYSNSVLLVAGSYNLWFVGPTNTLPTVGFYGNATRFAFSWPASGLTFYGNGRGDNTLTGYFNVLQADYGANRTINSFAVDFMQYDEGVTANWISGSFRYNSNIPVPEPATLLLLGLGAMMLRKREK